MGDKILIRFAELLKSVIRPTDLTGRIGGDEFLAFCADIHDEKIMFNKARFLNRQLLIGAKNFMGEDMNIPLGVSTGAVFVPDDGRNFATLMAKADKALYKVKHHGKHGCAFFGEETSTATACSSTSTMTITGPRRFTGIRPGKPISRMTMEPMLSKLRRPRQNGS